MALILPVNGKLPQLGNHCWLAPNATVVGDVIAGDLLTVWFNAVIRGDVNQIVLGNKVNVQDGAVIHCTYQKTRTVIGDSVSIAHNAIVHGCTIEPEVLVGMGAIIMDDAVVESRCIIGAGTIVPAKMVLKSGWVYAGAPAKALKPITEEQIALIARTAENYTFYKTWFEQ